MTREEKARENFLKGYNCAQAVLLAFEDKLGLPLDTDTLAKLAAPFGGGMGRMREVCGAVSGMLMVAGVLYGYDDPKATREKRELYAQVQAMAGQFREELGSIVCRDLLKNPPSDPNPTPRPAEFYAQRPCARMVMTAARLMDEFIAEHPIEA